jgi:hypothetical protein
LSGQHDSIGDLVAVDVLRHRGHLDALAGVDRHARVEHDDADLAPGATFCECLASDAKIQKNSRYAAGA